MLSWAGEGLVRSITFLSRLFKISEYLAAFFLVSFATSIPELFIGVSSALNGVPAFSLGNVLGANIIDITLILGLAGLMAGGISIERKISRKSLLGVFAMGVLPLFMAWDGIVSRFEGFLLLVVFFGYLYSISKEEEYFTAVFNNVPASPGEFLKNFFQNFGIFIAALALLLISSALLVSSAERLASRFAVSAFSFGVILIALGTTLPELVFGLKAVRLKHSAMAIGNSLGSVAFNSSFIVGLVSLIRPIEIVRDSNFIISAVFLFISLLLFSIFSATKSRLERDEVLLLFLVYLVFFFSQYYLLIT